MNEYEFNLIRNFMSSERSKHLSEKQIKSIQRMLQLPNLSDITADQFGIIQSIFAIPFYYNFERMEIRILNEILQTSEKYQWLESQKKKTQKLLKLPKVDADEIKIIGKLLCRPYYSELNMYPFLILRRIGIIVNEDYF